MLQAVKLKDIIKENLRNILKINDSLSDEIKYVIDLPSKYVRPILAILSGQIINEDISNPLLAAVSIELFHNFTLVHDDIMDNAYLRRGDLTVHKKWSVNNAILAGDVLLTLAYQNLNKIESSHKSNMLKILSATALQVCKGQELDLKYETIHSISQRQYMEVIRLKTGVLLGTSMQLGALANNVSSYELSQSLYAIGESLGIAFQLQDDLFDLYPPDGFGKAIGGDIALNKKTILTILANEKADLKTRDKLAKLPKETSKQQKIDETKRIFDSLNIKKYVIEEIKKIYQKSISQLENITEKKEAIHNLKSYIHNLFKCQI